MCQFKSGIILKNKIVVAPGKDDSHSNLLESLGIQDDYIGASKTFVRAELVPKNNEWWISPEEHPKKWTFVVDQDIVPEWFCKEESEKEFRAAVCTWWKSHILVDQKLEKLESGYYRLKRCEVKKLLNDVMADLYDSEVGEMRGSSQVGVMRESSQVGVMWESSRVGEMRGSSQVGVMRGSSRVGVMRGSSRVGEMRESSTAKDYKNYPKIKIWVSPEGNFEMLTYVNKTE